jgi:SAM-dependent methyltransferase
MALYPPFTGLGKPNAHLKRVIKHHVWHPRIDYEHRHEVEHNFDVISLLGWAGDPLPQKVPISPWKEEILAPDTIGLHMGSSETLHMRKKRWPIEMWVELLDLLPSKYPIVFLGGPGEKQDVDRVIGNLKSRPKDTVRSLVGKLNLKQVAGVVKECILFLSNDTGLMHMASAVRTSVVGIFGPTLPSKTRPWGNPQKNRVVRVEMDCSPCYADPKILFKCPRQKCLEAVTPARVLEVVEDCLVSRESPEGRREQSASLESHRYGLAERPPAGSTPSQRISSTEDLARMREYWDLCARENARRHIAIKDWETEEKFSLSGIRDIRIILESPHIHLPGGGNVLEIGAGIGRLLKPLALERPDLKVYGVDVSEEMISQGGERLKEFGNITLLATNGRDLRVFKDEFFDFVFSFITFQHIPRSYVHDYFREVHRVLKRTGLFRFQMQIPPGEGCPDPPDSDYRSIRYYSEEQVKQICEESGFEVLRISRPFYMWVTCRNR